MLRKRLIVQLKANTSIPAIDSIFYLPPGELTSGAHKIGRKVIKEQPRLIFVRNPIRQKEADGADRK